jgi:acetyl-CoA carboxylase carboxyl transferase subunit alpha
MMTLRVPIIVRHWGGGSGGALGIGVADRVLILRTHHSGDQPEACSAILWKDRKHAPRRLKRPS